ncbi:sigma-70 family RNA polymerase sigma factor [Candidatus Curtissbacteria bacterium]|nr:sigma-70 family RNA polymerase sigma factor [Candidatus Curtissbacteria bacterium]
MDLTYDRQKLIEAWRSDKAEALTQLYKESFKKIYRYVYFRVYSEEDAQDVTEEVYLKLIAQLDNYDGKESISSWVYQIARTQIANFWKGKYKLDQKFIDELITGQDDIDEDNQKAKDKVEQILKELPENYSQVLNLRFLRGYSLEECAKAIGTTVANIKVLQFRALKKAGELGI